MAAVLALSRRDNRVMEHLDTLVNGIGPRLTGSKRLTAACEWARGKFDSFGLDARLEKWGEIAVGFDRGPWSGRVLGSESEALVFTTNSWTPGTDGPLAGRAVLMPKTPEEALAMRSQLRGAWVIVPAPPAPAARRPRGERGQGGPPAGAASAPASRPRGPALTPALETALDECGVAGRVRTEGDDLVHTGGNYRVQWSKLPTRVSIDLRRDQHAAIVERLEKGEDVRLEFDVRNAMSEGPVPVFNVIADLKGSEKPDEFVIVGGHIDSWDGATGATDNGTGVATTLEAARLLAESGARPKRTIRFMLWSGEEQGLLGSREWVKVHADVLPKISAVLVHDGGTNYVSGIGVTAAMLPIVEPALAPLRDWDAEMPFEIHEVKGLSGGGSDHASFLAQNVPGFFWDQKGRNDYDHGHHTQHDTFDAAIPEYQRHTAGVVAAAALEIANLDQLLPREGLRVPGGGGGFPRRRLGVDLSEDMAIEEIVDTDALAATSGMRVGDVILKVADVAISDREGLRAALNDAPEKTTITIKRAGKEMAIPVTLPPLRAASQPASAPSVSGSPSPAASTNPPGGAER